MAMYLASAAVGLILAKMSKAQIGSSYKFTGWSFFFGLDIAAKPMDKILRAPAQLRRLQLTQGCCKVKDHETLVGLLVHC